MLYFLNFRVRCIRPESVIEGQLLFPLVPEEDVLRELAVRALSSKVDFWVPLLLGVVAKDIVWFNIDRPGAAENALVLHSRILLYYLLQWHSSTRLGNHAANYCNDDDEQENYSCEDLVESVFVPRLLGGPFHLDDSRLR